MGISQDHFRVQDVISNYFLGKKHAVFEDFTIIYPIWKTEGNVLNYYQTIVWALCDSEGFGIDFILGLESKREHFLCPLVKDHSKCCICMGKGRIISIYSPSQKSKNEFTVLIDSLLFEGKEYADWLASLPSELIYNSSYISPLLLKMTNWLARKAKICKQCFGTEAIHKMSCSYKGVYI